MDIADGDRRQPERNSSLRRNIASTYAARLAVVGASFILFPLVARHVGLTMLGLWLVVNSFTVFFALDFGMSTSLVRYVSDAHTRDDTLEMGRCASSVVALLAAMGVLGSVAFLAGIALFRSALDVPPGEGGTFVVMILAVVVSNFLLGLPLSAFRTVIAGVQRYDVVNALVLGQAALRVVIVVGVVMAGGGIVGVVLAEALVAVLGSAASVVASRRLVPGLRIAWNQASWTKLRTMAPFGFQVFVINSAAIAILYTDNLVIGALLSTAAVTLYAGAFRIYQVCRELANCLTAPLIPEASRRNVLGHDLAPVFVVGTKYSNALMVMIAVPVTVFARDLVVAWAGPEFVSVDSVLRILVLGLLVNNNHLVAVSLLTGIGKLRRYTRYYVVWALANLVLSIVLARRYGLVGVALGTSLPVVVLEPFYIHTALRTFGVSLGDFLVSAVGRVLLPAVVVGMPMLMLIVAWPIEGFAQVAVWSILWGLLYGVAFAGFGLGGDERRAVLASARQLRR